MHESTANKKSSTRTADVAPVNWQNLIWLIALWTAAPAALRCVTIWQNTPMPGSVLAMLGLVFAKSVPFLPQDLLIAVECVFILWLLKVVLVNSVFGDWGERIAVILATVLYGCIQSYVLYDFLLYLKTRVRLDLSMLGNISPVELFTSSNSTTGIVMLLCSIGAVLALVAYVGKQIQDRIHEIHLGRRQIAAFGVIAVFAFGSHCLVPAEARYVASNTLLTDQINFCLAPFRGDKEDLTKFNTRDLLTGFRRNERFEISSADCPLYKDTQGFTGEKTFDIKVGAEEKPHVIFYQIESFRAANVGVLGAKYAASPNFDEFAKHGIVFTNFYSNAVLPARSGAPCIFGMPTRLMPMSLAVTKPAINLIGIPDILRARGYHNAMFYSGLVETENMGEFFRSHGFDDVVGVNDIARAFPKATRTPWGVHDEYLVHHVVNQLERQDRQQIPTFCYVQTSSNRRPWQVPPTYQPLKVEVPLAAEYTDYLKTFHYSDACLGLLLKHLHERNLAHKTIVFIYGSSGMPMGEHQDNCAPINYAFEENFRVPLLIVAPGRIERPVTVNEPGSQIDLLPTLMDILNLTGPNHALGSSLVRTTPDRVVPVNNPFGSQYIALRQGRFKYIYALRNNTAALYDLTTDPDETRNVIAEHAEIAEAFHNEASSLTQFMSRQYLSETFVPPTQPREKQ